MKQLSLFLLIFLFAHSLISCSKEDNTLTKIGIIGDPHYLSEQLMDDGSAIKNYDSMSGKAIREVPFVLEQVLDDYMQSDINVLLIPGDITKDGEKQSHIDFVKKLRPLIDKGVKIYVIPGNHDINIPNPKGYRGDETYGVDNISPTDFAEIYADCGYNAALKKDPSSLSYVAELNKTTWLLAIDACRYREYTDVSISAGKISTATEQWIVEVMEEAKRKNVQVVGMMHHGLVEHIVMQATFFPDYIVDDWQRLASLFADMGMKAIFTGHFHANDITEYVSRNGNKIYDIETGSLSAYAFPYRFVELSSSGLKITTKNIISTRMSPDLGEKNREVMKERAKQIALEKINARGMILPEATLSLVTDIISQVFVMHLSGDETIDDNLGMQLQRLSKELDSPVDMSSNLFSIDMYPADNNVDIYF